MSHVPIFMVINLALAVVNLCMIMYYVRHGAPAFIIVVTHGLLIPLSLLWAYNSYCLIH